MGKCEALALSKLIYVPGGGVGPAVQFLDLDGKFVKVMKICNFHIP